ncbi:MAG: Homoserine O-acetyltransferase [Phycisphaerae bacterium]|nr:Homoserine O-acetyltransferase [Phycisphaerae bacterium]
MAETDRQTEAAKFEADYTPGSASAGIVQPRDVTLAGPPDELTLSCGRRLGPIRVRYETLGTLNEARDNAVLIIHALTGDAHVAGLHAAGDAKTGWWDIMVGPGKPIDTDKYFVICSNCLGGCSGTTGPADPNPATGRPWGLDFPIITVEDMVHVQRLLIDHLGIEKLLCVTGGSLGGQQALAWPILYPDRVATTMVIAAAARLSPQAIAWNAIGRNAIVSDPDFNGGQFYGGPLPRRGLAIARMIGHITYLSEEKMRWKFGRQLRNAAGPAYDFSSEFEVETYLDHQGNRFVERFDANSYLYFTKAMDYFDLVAQHGTLDAAMARASSRFLVVSFTTDWLFPAYQSREIVNALIRTGKRATYANLKTDHGHDAFLLEFPELHRIVRGFLDESAKQCRVR